MGIWSSLVNALGLTPSVSPREPVAFEISPRGTKQLRVLPAGQGIGMIEEISSAEEVFQGLISEAQKIRAGIGA